MRCRANIWAIALAVLPFTVAVRAEETDASADDFLYLYLTTCMQNINGLDALRNRLITDKNPKLPSEKAGHFLLDKPGDAWPVPHRGQMGNFVLALPAAVNHCSLYARRANSTAVERQFIALVANAPAPLVSERNPEEAFDTATNGRTHTISYTWSLPKAKRKMLFMLTTANSENAQIQALGSASVISE